MVYTIVAMWRRDCSSPSGGCNSCALCAQPAASGEEPEIEQAVALLRGQSLEDLRRQAVEDAVEQPERREGRRSYIERSASVRAYVLKRADGICESCRKPAPFRRSNGEPYLEPHHIRRLADGGPDHPRWVGAVCPTCHREIHHGEKGGTRNDELQKKLALMEGEQHRLGHPDA